MYGQFGSKWLYITCIAFFEVGSAICGAAPSINAFIVGRAICGAGGAGMYTGVMTLLSVSTTEQERALYLGIPGLTWGTATVLGPIIGGAFTISSVGWRYAFYINLFIGAAFAAITIWLVPSPDPRPGAKLLDRIREIDFVGLILITGIVLSGLMAISFGGSVYAWNGGAVIACFVVSAVLIILYWLQQCLCIGTKRERRSIPLHFLRNKTLMIIFINETCTSTATFVSIYFLPLYFQFVRSDRALMAGVRLLPLVCFLVTMIFTSGAIASRTGQYPAIFLLGGVLVLIGGTLMYTVTSTTSTANIYGYTIIIGTGAGLYLQLAFAAAQTEVEPVWIPVAVGFISFAQLVAPALMLSVANSIFLNKATSGLSKLLPDAGSEVIAQIISGVDLDYLDSLGSSTREAAIQIIVKSMSKVYIPVFTAGALTTVLTAFWLAGNARAKKNSSGP